jgi:hypothetical protein
MIDTELISSFCPSTSIVPRNYVWYCCNLSFIDILGMFSLYLFLSSRSDSLYSYSKNLAVLKDKYFDITSNLGPKRTNPSANLRI